ncbi:MAG: leucine-rich repeat domain-containing protein [Clostridia bacterium]|nr:leucine-rich repeat domain-containing protein [Clostridia bacterium]
MSSYNNIQKIKYTKTPTDVVALHEYIMFEDAHAKEKYVVFKFANNVNQRLYAFQFEVLQYNKDNELIEKSVVSHSNFVAEANDLFVPNAKLKVNFECQSIEVKLETAKFDRVLWNNGEFSESLYSFDEYSENLSKASGTVPVPDTKKSSKEKKKTQKKQNKLGFNIINIFRRNKAVFPSVFNVILCVIFVGLVIASTFYFKSVTGAFAVDDFVVKENSTGFVTILNYSGTEDNVEIPSKLGDYSVTKIGAGAFKKSGVKNIEIKTKSPLTIETGAFKGCSKLTKVSGTECDTVTVMEGAFTNCKSLSTFIVPNAILSRKCFDGTAVKKLTFDTVIYQNGKLIEIFNGVNSITLELDMNFGSIDDYDTFLSGVKVR